MFKKIIKGCRKRHRKSQKELYEMYYAYGMSITLRYADTRNEAAAILNDSFMKVYDNIKEYNLNRPFKPWFRRILINTAINHYHKTKKEKERPVVDLQENSISEDESIISGITYREMIEMVQLLSPVYRTIFNLYVIEGYTHKEIARKLHIAEGTSKSNLFKAKQNLRSILEKKLTLPNYNARK
ncbi:MAG: RNA polymerase sigma factor [Rhodohalobacter sp.]|uniref:RNA polymerase sigma factor n=1 Tax=Rhodohalobacter sp. TaxID=1974210 RepID=UPI00397675B4